jgi:hypothetical protein
VLDQRAVKLALRVLDCDDREVVSRVVALAAEILSVRNEVARPAVVGDPPGTITRRG